MGSGGEVGGAGWPEGCPPGALWLGPLGVEGPAGPGRTPGAPLPGVVGVPGAPKGEQPEMTSRPATMIGAQFGS